MDVGELLRTARRRAGVNQRVLAQRVGTHRSVITKYESGAVSPTVSTLDRLLAGCGLQARVLLEPLHAEVDARVDRLISGEATMDTDALPRLIRVLEDDEDADHGSLFGTRPQREGPVRWAFDGATALQLQGLAADVRFPAVAVVFDDAARWWLRAIGAMGYDGRGYLVSWLDVSIEEAEEALRGDVFTLIGFMRVRPVTALPPALQVVVPWYESPVPVVSVDEVERSHPEHEEVLRRRRERERG